MKSIISIAVLLIASSNAVSDTVSYIDGDTSCSGSILKFTRVNAPCNPIKCFATSQGINKPASVSSQTMCPSSMNDPAPKSSGSANFAVLYSYAGTTTCNDSMVAQVDGVLADGKCHMIGNKFTMASCAVGGSVFSHTCDDSNCSTNCVATIDGTDNICVNSIKYKCLSSSVKTSSNGNSGNADSASSQIAAFGAASGIASIIAIML